jgi:hypothetical protein
MPMDGGGRVERRCAECSTCRHSDMHVSAMTWLAKLVVAAKCVLHLSGLHPLPCGVSFYFILKDSLLGSVPLWHTFVPQLVMCAPGAATLNLTACARGGRCIMLTLSTRSRFRAGRLSGIDL